MTARLELEGVAKSFGAKSVLSQVTLRCEPGTVTGLVGRNGSGKTTLLRCVTGQLAPDAGVVRLDGEQLGAEPSWRRARRGIAWTFQDLSMPLEASVAELRLAAQRGVGRPRAGRNAGAGLNGALGAFESQPWRQLSFGQRKLASLAIALDRRPAALLLDEPAAGLSETFLQCVIGEIRDFVAGGGSALVIEHNRSFLSSCADAIAVLSKGTIVFHGPPDAAFSDTGVFEALI